MVEVDLISQTRSTVETENINLLCRNRLFFPISTSFLIDKLHVVTHEIQGCQSLLGD